MFRRISTILVLGAMLCITSGVIIAANAKKADKQVEAQPVAVPGTEKLVASGNENTKPAETDKADEAEAPVEGDYEYITINVDDLEPVNEDLLIGYKDPDYYYNRFDRPYSPTTVIVSADPEIITKEAMDALCEKYDLSIVYDYVNFNMYALATNETLEDDAFNRFIEELSKEEGILSVEKDYIVTLDPVMPSLETDSFGMSVELY